MDEGLRQAIIAQLAVAIKQGEPCFLCTAPAQIACVPGPQDQLRLMQALPEDQKGKVSGLGFPLCRDCIEESPDTVISTIQAILLKQAQPKIREPRLAKIIPFKKKEVQAI